MNLRNTPDEFGLISKILHWLIAVMVICQIPIGWYTSGLDEETVLYWRMLDVHIVSGLTIFTLAVVKWPWMMLSPRPAFLPDMTVRERAAARIVHGFFNIALVIIPVIGFLYVASNGEPINLYDVVEIPDVGKFTKNVRNALYDAHMILAYSCAALIVLHIAAALKHHFIDRNDMLRRMTCSRDS